MLYVLELLLLEPTFLFVHIQKFKIMHKYLMTVSDQSKFLVDLLMLCVFFFFL